MKKNRETCKPRAQFKQRLFILCRHAKHRCELSRYLKRFMMESRFLASFIGVYITVVSVKCLMWKSVSQPDIDAVFGNNYWFQITETPSLSIFWQLTGWGLHRFCWKFQREHLQLKARSIELYHCQPTHLLLIGEYLYRDKASLGCFCNDQTPIL